MKIAIVGSLLIIVCLASFGQVKSIQSLVEIEKEFATYCLTNPQAEAWTKYFASDGIMFTPDPVNAIEFMKPRLGSTRKAVNRFRWEAGFSDISVSGDMGFNIGPLVIENVNDDTAPKNYGYIFSIWKVENGEWKVIVDAGIGVNEKTEDHDLTGKVTFAGKTKAGSGNDPFLEAELRFNEIAKNKRLADAYKEFLADEARQLRHEYPPFKGRKESLTWLNQENNYFGNANCSFSVDGSGSSMAKDFAYTYGKYVITSNADSEEGLFVHVWKRINGKWRLAVDATRPNPKEE